MNIDDKLVYIAQTASELLYKYLYKLIEEVEKKQEKEFSNELFHLQQIAISCQLTNESICMLIGNRKIWDADILCRTVLEGTIKMLYMTKGTKQEQIDKFNEFWNLQPQFEKFKKSKKALELLTVIDKIEDEKFKFIKDMIVTEEEMKKFEKSYPKNIRKQLDMRWSFNNMIQCLSKEHPDKLEPIIGLTYSYNLSSNLVHMDAMGINIVRERVSRGELRSKLADLAHASRIISDILSLSMIRLEIIYDSLNLDFKALDIPYEEHKQLIKFLEEQQQCFTASEAEEK